MAVKLLHIHTVCREDRGGLVVPVIRPQGLICAVDAGVIRQIGPKRRLKCLDRLLGLGLTGSEAERGD